MSSFPYIPLPSDSISVPVTISVSTPPVSAPPPIPVTVPRALTGLVPSPVLDTLSAVSISPPVPPPLPTTSPRAIRVKILPTVPVSVLNTSPVSVQAPEPVSIPSPVPVSVQAPTSVSVPSSVPVSVLGTSSVVSTSPVPVPPPRVKTLPPVPISVLGTSSVSVTAPPVPVSIPQTLPVSKTPSVLISVLNTVLSPVLSLPVSTPSTVPVPTPTHLPAQASATTAAGNPNYVGFEDGCWYKIRNVGDNNVIQVDPIGNKLICMPEDNDRNDLQRFQAIRHDQKSGKFRIVAKYQKSPNAVQVWDFLTHRQLLIQRKESARNKFTQNWISENVPGYNSLYLIQSGETPESQMCLKNLGEGQQIQIINQSEACKSDHFSHWVLDLQDIQDMVCS